MNNATIFASVMLLLQATHSFADANVPPHAEKTATDKWSPITADGERPEINVRLANNDEREDSQSWSDLWE